MYEIFMFQYAFILIFKGAIQRDTRKFCIICQYLIIYQFLYYLSVWLAIIFKFSFVFF